MFFTACSPNEETEVPEFTRLRADAGFQPRPVRAQRTFSHLVSYRTVDLLGETGWWKAPGTGGTAGEIFHITNACSSAGPSGESNAMTNKLLNFFWLGYK